MRGVLETLATQQGEAGEELLAALVAELLTSGRAFARGAACPGAALRVVPAIFAVASSVLSHVDVTDALARLASRARGGEAGGRDAGPSDAFAFVDVLQLPRISYDAVRKAFHVRCALARAARKHPPQ